MSRSKPFDPARLGLPNEEIAEIDFSRSDTPFMAYEIHPEAPGDSADIANLIEKSFGPERTKRTVHLFRIGRNPIQPLCFVGRADGMLVASIRFWMVQLPDGRQVPMLGPLAVDPSLRGYGVGRALVRHALEAVENAGHPAVLIVGDPGYYAPFGFSVALVKDLEMPGPVGPLTFMGLELTPDALCGFSGMVEPIPV